MTNPNPISCGLLAGLLAWGSYVSYYAVRFGLDHPPSATGDEPDYDSLGWELAHGHGFRVDYSNPEFRRPYEAAAEDSELYRLMTEDRAGRIANRPPLLPLVMSLADRLLGRQFWSVRFLNALCMAAICGMVVTLVAREMADRVAAGRVVTNSRQVVWQVVPLAISWTLFVVVDTRTRLYGRAILTEALAAVEVAGVCWLLFRLAKRPTLGIAVWIGVLLAVAILTRTQFILWLPGLVAIVFWLAFRQSCRAVSESGKNLRESTLRWRQGLLVSGVMVLATLAVSAPWMVRNCLALGEFMPLGSQGWVQLSAAFGDWTWDRNGLWTNLESEGFFEGVATPEMSLLEAEVAMAHYSREQALAWIAEHPGRALALAPIKIAQECRPRTIPEAVILMLSALGAVLAWKDLRTWILLAVSLACCVSIAATWSVEGRFLVPLLFAQHGLIGLGLVRVCSGGAGSATASGDAK